MDNKELELAYDLLTADEESILTKAVQDKGTDCDEMKVFRSTNSWRLERLDWERGL